MAAHVNYEPGDIIFVKSTRDDSDLKWFSSLAGFVQTQPYAEPREWFHVAVVVTAKAADPSGMPMVVEFDATRWPFGAEITRKQLETSLEMEFDVLRRSSVADSLASRMQSFAAQRMPYASLGMLAFAAQMQARLFTAAGRQNLERFARGAERAAREHTSDLAGPPAETCVTAVARALHDCGITLDLVEPPVPLTDLKSPKGFETPLDRFYGYAGFPGPGQDDSTATYISRLNTLITDSFKPHYPVANNISALADVGEPPQFSWTASPAMLYDALLSAGFSEVPRDD